MGGSGRPPTTAVAVLVLVVAAVVLAVLKPWTALDEPVPTRRPSPTASLAAVLPPTSGSPAASSPTPVPSPRDPRAFRCLGGRHWTLVTDEAQGSRELRSWIRIDPLIGATGPDDPGIPWTRVGADAVRAIGVCLPNAPSLPGASPVPDAAGTTIVVRRPRDSAWPARWGWEEVPVVPWAGDMSVLGGAMVAPAGGGVASDEGAPWPVGGYVVEVRPGSVGPSAWFGLRIVGPSAGDGAVATPSSAPSSAPTSTPPGAPSTRP